MKDMTPFKIACFVTLMSNHGDGFRDTSPNYAMEKVRMLEESEESCFARLDVSNMAEVIYWMKKWGQPLPTDVEIYLKELGAVYYDGILTDFQGLS